MPVKVQLKKKKKCSYFHALPHSIPFRFCLHFWLLIILLIFSNIYQSFLFALFWRACSHDRQFCFCILIFVISLKENFLYSDLFSILSIYLDVDIDLLCVYASIYIFIYVSIIHIIYFIMLSYIFLPRFLIFFIISLYKQELLSLVLAKCTDLIIYSKYFYIL